MPIHNIPPVYNENSKILILGSFPSVKSRESNFFYGHPQNRMWKLLSALFACKLPITVDDKKALLLNNNLAMWDVIASCDIVGSSDSSIKNAVPNDISEILGNTDIRLIVTNGKKADALYRRYILPSVGIEPLCLPSTSPANAAYSLDRLIDEWKRILNY